MPTSPQDAGGAPDSRGEQSHSGRLLLRMPQSLHAELARAAEAEGVSLNAFITSALASAVEWRRPGEPEKTAPQAAPSSSNGDRAVAVLAPPDEHRGGAPSSPVLVANLIVVGVVAVAAIALLVVGLATLI